MMFNWLKRDEFTWLNKQGVLSSKGFSLQSTGRFTVEYREVPNCLTLDVENGLSNGDIPCLIVSPDAFNRWDGSERDFPEEKRAVIRANIERALKFQGLLLEVAEPISFFDHLMQSRDGYVQMLQAGKRLSINGIEISDTRSLDAFIEGHRGS